ncbi:MAG: family 43 glycosylhydrolase, partial [Nitrospira sp.]
MRAFPIPFTVATVILASTAWSQESASPLDAEAARIREHRAKYNYTRVQPLLDVPMIDAAITRGPDGMYYLTAMMGTPDPGSGSINFSVNDGIRLWRSKDLRSWEELGLVAPRSVVKARVDDLGLLRTAREADEMMGLLAPEIHFVKGNVYLTYSLKPCGTGLLKSRSGRPEGPYEDVGLITKCGQDASLFVDDDGSVYWVFGGGWIARMNDAMTALAEKPWLIQPYDPRPGLSPGGQILQVGQAGAFLFKKDGIYHLLAAGIHGRLGVPCYDTWVATAKSLRGPWSRRKLAVPHGGQSTMFEGPDGQWYATFSGVDSRAALRERPAIVPVDWVESIRYYASKGEPWPYKKPQVITEAWGWENARPVSDLAYRDPVGVNGGDGYFYLTGLHLYQSHGRNTHILKGKDLTGATPWETIPVAGFKTVDDIPWFQDPGPKSSKLPWLIFRCKIFQAKDTFWITLVLVPGGKRVLRSESGTMNGPWKVTGEPPHPEPTGEHFWGSIPFED